MLMSPVYSYLLFLRIIFSCMYYLIFIDTNCYLLIGCNHFRGWFGEDGRLKCLNDPLLERAFHPPMFNAKSPDFLKPQYKPVNKIYFLHFSFKK